MRVSTGMIFDLGVLSMNRQTASLLHLQQQVADGRRIISPSDDPVAAARALEVTQARAVNAQFAINQKNATSALAIEESQLTSATDVIGRVRELAVQAGNTHLAASDRKAIAFELRARFDELLGLANATDGSGQYLFSGYMGSTQPFGGTIDAINAAPGNEITYFGDDGQRQLQVSPSRYLEVSDSGNDAFKRVKNGNSYYVTGYAAGNTGGGIIDGGRVTDPALWNAAANKNYSVDFSIDQSLAPPVTYYDIIDTTSGNSILTNAPPVANDFPNMLKYTPGQPIPLKGATIDLGSTVTIDGAPVAGDSFSITPSTAQSLFSTVAHLVGKLETTNLGAPGAIAKLGNDIGFALTNLDQVTDNILRVQAMIGSRMNEVESLTSVNQDLDIQYSQTLSQLQDLDYAKAISDLIRKKTDLEAAQQSFARISQLSLFNYL